jgi:hypothetical protein
MQEALLLSAYFFRTFVKSLPLASAAMSSPPLNACAGRIIAFKSPRSASRTPTSPSQKKLTRAADELGGRAGFLQLCRRQAATMSAQ